MLHTYRPPSGPPLLLYHKGEHLREKTQLYVQTKLYFRTLGEDHGIDSQMVGRELHRAVAYGLCKGMGHHPVPCLTCLQAADKIIRPIGRALFIAGKYERGYDREIGYAAAGAALEHFIKELTGADPFRSTEYQADEEQRGSR